MKVKGVFFDLYGTLLLYGDMDAAWADWLSALHGHLVGRGLAMSRDSLASYCDGLFSRPQPSFCEDGLSLYERRLKALLCGELGLRLTHSEIGEAATASLTAWDKHSSLDPEAVPVLRALTADKVVALVSNFDHPPHIHSVVNDLGLKEFFDPMVISGEVGFQKPDPRIFQHALERTGLLPADVLYVGDSVEHDVEGALAAGIRPVLIRRDKHDPGAVANDFRVRRIDSEGRRCASHVAVILRLSELTGTLLD